MPQEAIVAAVNAAKAARAKLAFDNLFEVARQFDVSIEALLWRMKSVYRIPADKVRGYIESFQGQTSFWDGTSTTIHPVVPSATMLWHVTPCGRE